MSDAHRMTRYRNMYQLQFLEYVSSVSFCSLTLREDDLMRQLHGIFLSSTVSDPGNRRHMIRERNLITIPGTTRKAVWKDVPPFQCPREGTRNQIIGITHGSDKFNQEKGIFKGVVLAISDV